MSKIITLVSAIISIYLAYQGYQVKSVYEEKTRQQTLINREVADTAMIWESLEPVRESWDRMFEPLSDIRDLYSINNALNLDQTTFMYEMTNVIDGGRENISYQGVSIGLVRACIQNENAGFHVQSRNINEMLADIAHLERRHSISFSEVTIVDGGEGRKHILFDSLCVLLRGEDAF